MVWRFRGGAAGYLTDVSASIFVLVYVGLFASFATLLLVPADGAYRILTFLIVVVCSDVGGYAAGVLFGRHPDGAGDLTEEVLGGLRGLRPAGRARRRAVRDADARRGVVARRDRGRR